MDIEINGTDIRVCIPLPDDNSISIVLTSEGVIWDAFKDGEPVGTSSITYEEKFWQLFELSPPCDINGNPHA